MFDSSILTTNPTLLSGISDLSGDDGVYDGMYTDNIIDYFSAINVFEYQEFSPTFAQVKSQIDDQKDPIYATFTDFYDEGVSDRHAIVIIGYYDSDIDYCVIVDTNICVTTYLVKWDYLIDHMEDDVDSFVYTDGTGMAG